MKLAAKTKTLKTPRIPKPFYKDKLATLYHGDSLDILKRLADKSADAVITDPPYSSGGMFRSDRARKTSDKYTLTQTKRRFPEFYGDNRDQRALLLWCSVWLNECLRIVKPGGYLMTFTDWRQIPVFSDAIQLGGWNWKGIVVWDKTEGTRPQMGWFRAQCEYVLLASNGPMPQEQSRTVRKCAPGCFRENVRAHEKKHMTGKPVQLMKEIMQVLPEQSHIVDPFAGSGTTAVAAKEMGHSSISMEMSREYCEITAERLCSN